MISARVARSATMTAWKRITFGCPNCGELHYFMHSENKGDVWLFRDSSPGICRKCFAIFPELSRIIFDSKIREFWHRTPDIYFIE